MAARTRLGAHVQRTRAADPAIAVCWWAAAANLFTPRAKRFANA